MKEEQKIITDFQLSLIADFHKNTDRQGPGSEEITKLALQFIEKLTDNAHIADIGCGTGGQTITLSEITGGSIKAVDFMPEFIEILNKKIKDNNLENRITTFQNSMDALPFSEKEFDLIWAEGSIYNMGFEYGLKYLHKFLKDNGYIAVSEVSWFTNKRPLEIEEFWNNSYPEIDVIPSKIKKMQDAGYIPVAHFIFPEQSWWNYFKPLQDDMENFLKRNNYSQGAQQFVKYTNEEIELYDKYKEYYGYVFYIGKKV